MSTADNPLPPAIHSAKREKLPEVRASIDRRFHIKYSEANAHKPGEMIAKELKLYAIAGMYDDGRLGEVFFRGEKQGELISGALDIIATTISLGLQYGVPLQVITSKMRGAKFGPAQQFGLDDPDFKSCTSVFDLIAQWLDSRFPDGLYRKP